AVFGGYHLTRWDDAAARHDAVTGIDRANLLASRNQPIEDFIFVNRREKWIAGVRRTGLIAIIPIHTDDIVVGVVPGLGLIADAIHRPRKLIDDLIERVVCTQCVVPARIDRSRHVAYGVVLIGGRQIESG